MMKASMINRFLPSLLLVLALAGQQVGLGSAQDATSTKAKGSSEERLRKKLLAPDDYEKSVLPSASGNQSSPVVVDFGMDIIRFHVDEMQMLVNFQVWYKASWLDSRLSWNPDDYDGLKHIRLPGDQVWRPDIQLYNDDGKQGAASAINANHDDPVNAVVTSDGRVLYVPVVLLSAICMSMDFTNWPYDVHSCSLKFGSWTFDGYSLDLEVSELNQDTTTGLKYLDTPANWKLRMDRGERLSTTYACCPEPYVSVNFPYTVCRVPKHVENTLLTPLHIVVVLTLVAFWTSAATTVGVCLVNSGILIAMLQFHASGIPSSETNMPSIIHFSANLLKLQVALVVWTCLGLGLVTLVLWIPPVAALVRRLHTDGGILATLCCWGIYFMPAGTAAGPGAHVSLRRVNDGDTDGLASSLATEHEQQHHDDEAGSSGLSPTCDPKPQHRRPDPTSTLFLHRVLHMLVFVGFLAAIVSFFAVFWPVALDENCSED